MPKYKLKWLKQSNEDFQEQSDQSMSQSLLILLEVTLLLGARFGTKNTVGVISAA